MRYHYEKPDNCILPKHGEIYICNHPVYDRCTLFREGEKGLAVIQQRCDETSKISWWSCIDSYLCDELYSHPQFKYYFEEMAGEVVDGLYPTVTIRQIMWALRMKPLKKERWETVFDRSQI